MALSMDVAIEDVSISVDAYINIDQMVINKRHKIMKVYHEF